LGTVTFTDCNIYGNTAETTGGGVYVQGSSTELTFTD